MFNMANFYTKRAIMKFLPFFLIPLMCVAELPKPLCPIPAKATYFAVGAGQPFETSFEEQAPENVEENPHSGKQCYKFQGDGKYSYRKFILALEPEASYEVTMMMRKMEFSATVNEKEEIFKPEYTTLLRKHKGVVEYLSRMTGATVDAEIRTQVEYDGMMRIDFTIIPRGCVALNHFNYKITMDNAQAKYLHYTGSRDSGMSLNVQKSSFTMAIPKQERLVWESPFKLLVWLGSEDKGFLWFACSEKEWSPLSREKRPDALKVVRGNAGTSLQITPVLVELLIARPTT